MSKQSATRSASDLWAALEEQALDDEMEAVLAMSPEERRRELREAGFDLEKVHADADALFAEPARPALVAVLRPRRRLGVALLAAAALAAGVALVVRSSAPDIVGHGRDDAPGFRAAGLRREARDACGARSWQACLDKLNQARALDPDGDEAPEVQALRRSAGDPAARP